MSRTRPTYRLNKVPTVSYHRLRRLNIAVLIAWSGTLVLSIFELLELTGWNGFDEYGTNYMLGAFAIAFNILFVLNKRWDPSALNRS